MKNKLLIISSILFISGLIVSSFWIQDYPAPNITVTTIKGESISLASLKGQPLIVSFWATDCASCIEEIPHLIELYQQFHSQGLEIIAIAMYYDPPNHVVEMTRLKKIPYKVALDLKSHHAQAFGNVQLTPTTFLISPTGDIIMQKTGLFNKLELQNKIQQLILG